MEPRHSARKLNRINSVGPRKAGQSPARTARWLAALALAACLAPHPGAAATPSPDDWRDVVIYQIVTDRFSDGDPSNDAVEGHYAPADGYQIHGGDFAGIEQRLDYLVNLGVGAIWISPVPVNVNAEYHGYAARDLFSIAPHFGTLSELQSLVNACHARGISVIIDVVMNHMGDLIDSGDAGYPAYKYPGTYTLRWRDAGDRYSGVLDDLTKFHAHGQIGNFTDPEQILGELFGLDDLKTEDPTVRALLVQAAEWLIGNTDCDGFRIDTVKHVEMDFWDTWCPQVHGYAAGLGKNAFFMFGEIYDGSDVKCGSYTGTVTPGNYKLDSVLYFPMYFTTTGVFGFDNPPSWIGGEYGALGAYDPTSRERLVTFLDNHDDARFLSFGIANQDEAKLRTALGWLLTSRGVPAIYYGTEQEFDGGGDPYNREDMWDGQWDFGPSDGDNFDLVHPLFRYTAKLLQVRRRHAALRRGETIERYVEGGGPGLYLYERRSDDDTVLVAVNNANAPIERPGTGTPWPAGAGLVDAIGGERDTTGTGGTITLRVPARGVLVIESLAAAQAGAAAAPLAVTSAFPGHDQRLNDLHTPLTLHFDRDVDLASLAAGFSIVPAVSGIWTGSGATSRYVPDAPWPAGTAFTWRLEAPVHGADGHALAAPFEATFSTVAHATGVTVPDGFVADRIARQGLSEPQGITPAPAGYAAATVPPLDPNTLLVSDTGRDRIFTLSPGGDLGPFIGDSRWIWPEGVAGDSADVLVADANGLFEIDPGRIARVLTPGSNATQTGAVVTARNGFAGRAYLADPASDRLLRVDASGVTTPFASGIKGAEGLAFGPGGAWGTDLYVADADLTSLSPWSDGPGRIVRVDAAGVATTLVQDPATLGGACGLAFDTAGRFGGDLFVADILDDRIYRVTPAGQVSLFASGFADLSGSHCIAFGGDGALYVADRGDAQSFTQSVWRIAPETAVTAVPVRVGGALVLRAPAPNPASRGVTFTFTLPGEGPVSLEVFDPGGRRMRAIASGRLPAGTYGRVWDLADGGGHAVHPGVYLVRLAWNGEFRTRRLVVVR